VAQGLPREAQIGPRPVLPRRQDEGRPLKQKLSQCTGPFRKTDFSIGHRGAALQFPEHTKESYSAAARMGAGVIECDVTFTKDRQLVCRHSQCDLHTTTNILSMPALAAKCTMPFVQADPATGRKASAKCCTSDITLAEFRTLSAKMDGFNPNATTVAEYQDGTPRWRTDLYSHSGTLMTHDESIALIKGFGAKFTPELKAP
jgi:glycerophosphoryl diester phosphodiesterase